MSSFPSSKNITTRQVETISYFSASHGLFLLNSFIQDLNFLSQAASSDLKQLGFSVATRGMENAVEELSQLLNSNSQLVESDDR